MSTKVHTIARSLERRMSWLAIPHIAVLLVTLQAFGFLFVTMDSVWIERLALVPELVKSGEIWRLITFMALPLSMSPLWVIFALWFLYFVINSIESEWGSFKTTLYVLVSYVLMVAYSFVFDYPIVQISGFQSTLFLAAAGLFPEMEVQLFMVVPVKMKWLAWLTLAFLAVNLLNGSWLDRGYLISMYASYFLFFGPALLGSLKLWVRRTRYRKW